MKKYIYLALSLVALTACSLDKDPISDFNEKNMNGKGGTTIETKAQMKARYEATRKCARVLDARLTDEY